MADQLFMYAIMTGVFAAFAAVLFTARSKRHHERLESRDQKSSPIWNMIQHRAKVCTTSLNTKLSNVKELIVMIINMSYATDYH
jgi:CBS domain containing-hemolysin-like protein